MFMNVVNAITTGTLGAIVSSHVAHTQQLRAGN